MKRYCLCLLVLLGLVILVAPAVAAPPSGAPAQPPVTTAGPQPLPAWNPAIVQNLLPAATDPLAAALPSIACPIPCDQWCGNLGDKCVDCHITMGCRICTCVP